MREELQNAAREAEVVLAAAQLSYRRALWDLALEEYLRAWPTAEVVVMQRAHGFYDSVPVGIYDGDGEMLADLVWDTAPFGTQEPDSNYERMILEADEQPHDPVVQRAVDDAVARHADDDEVAVKREDLGTIYLSDVRNFLAGESPSEIALRRKQLTGVDMWRDGLAPEVAAAPVAVMVGVDGHGDHQGVVFPGEPTTHVQPTVWVSKHTLSFLSQDAGLGEVDFEHASGRRLELADIPGAMDVREVHAEFASLGYTPGLELFAVPETIPATIRGYHLPAEQAPVVTTVEGGDFSTGDVGPSM